MKKGFAILLLAVHTFNLAGYSLLFRYLIHQSDKVLIQKIDNNNYKDAVLVEMKIPLHLPYMNSKSEYERVDGSTEYNGVHYNYVKRKVSNDTLYIMCLPNVAKTQLYYGKTNYAKDVNDFPASKKTNESSSGQKGLFSEYNNPLREYNFDWNSPDIKQYNFVFSSHIVTVTLNTPEQPPEITC